MQNHLYSHDHVQRQVNLNEREPNENLFALTLKHHALTLRHDRTQVLQINVGAKCNQTCSHCHVNAGPARTEIMTRDTMNRIIVWLSRTDILSVDITGGAPEMNPHFRHLVESIKKLDPRRRISDRCNLTILLEPGQDDLAEFFAHHQVEIIASLPCYSQTNVDAQRGEGVFEKSIYALQSLNALGYGRDENLLLHLVYNPGGASLPGPQASLEAAYKRELERDYGIVFNRLYTLVNVPLARFANRLRQAGRLATYQELLLNAFNPNTVANLMCRTMLNVDWRGKVYDCDFNQMLDLPWRAEQQFYLWDIDPEQVKEWPVVTGDHCFACTAGAGSSCGGALVS
ncbi:arsenosugar biosynthesis radical SAM protein ArsS [candidate division KSB1 bacterium]|nr:arsenosugar biosynthesis radical SAM protein ArsS [candidate division KSB1 bacterium]